MAAQITKLGDLTKASLERVKVWSTTFTHVSHKIILKYVCKDIGI